MEDIKSFFKLGNCFILFILGLGTFYSVHIRAGHVKTFLKSLHSVLEQGPSAGLFRSRSNVLRARSLRSFFFRNDGIFLNSSIRSRERTIVSKERLPAPNC